MKDYRLSEIAAQCKSQDNCIGCPCGEFCANIDDYLVDPYQWKYIEPRDMIELPYINEIDRSKSAYTLDGKSYEVVFRDDDGSIKVKPVSSKEAAKEVVEFLLQKKEKK